jgi:hypothetical protein
MSFAFTVSDLETGKTLGGGLYPELSDEGAFVEAHAEFQRIFPERQIHVEEISIEQYEAQSGEPTGLVNRLLGFDVSDERMTQIADEWEIFNES